MNQHLPLVFSVPEEGTNPKFAAAFVRGCGGNITINPDAETGGRPWAGFGSPRVWGSLTRTIKAGGTWYYGDHAYFGRKKFYRVTKNAWQHDGTGVPDFKRLAPFHTRAMPWQKGGHIIVCPQSYDFHDRMGDGQWLNHTMVKLKLYTDREIIIRRKGDKRPLADDLKGAWCLITHTSNAAIESLLAGVPVICTGDCPATKMGLSDPINVEYPYYPDCVFEWAAVLAANQWTLDEIAAGKCWGKIQ